MIELRPANSGGYRAYKGGFWVGDIATGKVNLYSWQPVEMGMYATSTLREIADTLDELNAALDAHVRRECCGPSTERIGANYTPSPSKECPFDVRTNTGQVPTETQRGPDTNQPDA